MNRESRFTWLQLIVGASYWASWPVLVVLLYKTSYLTVTEGFYLLLCAGSGAVCSRLLGTLASVYWSTVLMRYHSLAMLLVALIGVTTMLSPQIDIAWFYFAAFASGYGCVIYSRGFDLSLVGSTVDLSGQSMPAGWVIGLIVLTTFIAQLLAPLVTMVPLPIDQSYWFLTVASGHVFSRLEAGDGITLAIVPTVVAALFLLFILKQWVTGPSVYSFKLQNRLSLKPLLSKNRHIWYGSVLYNMTLGSFIGFSFIFPLVLEVMYGHSTLMLVWIAPFLAILSRPLGHWLGTLFGGTVVTQICLLLMALFAAMAGQQISLSETSQDMRYFDVFFISMVGLIVTSAMGNGSVVVTLNKIFPAAHINRALSWAGSIAMIGAVYLPLRFGLAFANGNVDSIFIEVTGFFSLGFLANYWLYFRRHGDFYNP
ncbi:nitrate/nitrite transporter [Idiomarina seosinensis]|uniref:Nitrate/nitrite transporter n=1 Tax=Idiomarina seosinensis TaxID=281739 RepID=A0A432ZDY3_9GAMM|nr:nitrate/nitrite transporter [Idiomarina seosinensis]RUO76104.1 nitrate/nitrite transporter [Idiomarina seosinensis]